MRPGRADILVFASVLDSPDLGEAVGAELLGAQFVVAESEDDALAVLRESTPTLLVVGSQRSERLSVEATARGIATLVLDE